MIACSDDRRWLAPHISFPGTVTSLNLSARELESSAGLALCPALTRLDISSNRLPALDGIGAMEDLGAACLPSLLGIVADAWVLACF